MKVVLLKDDKRYGKKGDVIDVNDGFARNFLIPNKIVAVATNTNLNEAKQLKQSEQFKKDTALKEAEEMQVKLEATEVVLPVRIGENGKLFGSITSKEVSDKLEEQGLVVDKKKIDLSNGIKSIGLYTIKVKLHTKVVASLKVNVIAE